MGLAVTPALEAGKPNGSHEQQRQHRFLRLPVIIAIAIFVLFLIAGATFAIVWKLNKNNESLLVNPVDIAKTISPSDPGTTEAKVTKSIPSNRKLQKPTTKVDKLKQSFKEILDPDWHPF